MSGRDEDTLGVLVDLLADHVPAGGLTLHPPEETWLQALGVDSAEMINIIVAVEDRFGILIETAQLARLLTLRDIVDAIDELRAAAQT